MIGDEKYRTAYMHTYIHTRLFMSLSVIYLHQKNQVYIFHSQYYNRICAICFVYISRLSQVIS